jgi:hypothetical protein
MVFAASVNAAPIVIDTFSQPAAGQTVNSGPLTGSFSAVSGAGVLGTRNLSYTGVNVSTGNTWRTVMGEVLTVNGGLPGRLALNTFDSAVQVNLNYSGFGTLNATGMGSLEFVFNTVFDKGTGASYDVAVSLTTGSGTLTGTFSAPTSFAPLGGTLSIPLSSLSGPGSLSTITAIQVNLNDNGTPSASSDFALDTLQFAETPEPSSLVIMGCLAVASGAVYVRRRNRSLPTA